MTALPDPEDRLDSWKEIAAFLGRTVRTVQRWEKTEGLPVRRGGPGRGVVASKREVGDWWKERGASLVEEVEALPPIAKLPRLPAWWGLGAAGLLALAVSVWHRPDAVPPLPLDSPTPARGRVLSASTSEGQSFKHIDVGGYPANLTISPTGEYVFVALPKDQAIAVVRLADRRVVRRVQLSEQVFTVTVGSNPRWLLALGATALFVVDSTNWLVRALPMGNTVKSAVFEPDGRRAWIAVERVGLKILDLDTWQITSRPTVGCPIALAVGARTSRVYVAYQCGGPGGRWGHDAIEVVEAATGKSVLVGSKSPMVGSSLALSPDEAFLWADTADACTGSQYDQIGCPPGHGPVLVAFDTSSLDPLLTVRLPNHHYNSSPYFLPDGNRVLVLTEGVHVLKASLGDVEERLEIPGVMNGSLSADASRLYAVSPNSNSLLELPLDQNADARAIHGLGVYWPLDGTANDVVGGTHGLNVSARFEPGRLGRAAAFDATTTGIDFGRRFDVNVLGGLATVGAWIKPARLGRTMTLMERRGLDSWRIWIDAEGHVGFCLARAAGQTGCGAGLMSRQALHPGEWRHVSVTLSETQATLHLDGVRESSANLEGFRQHPGDLADPTRTTELGASFDGLIDEVAVFRRILSESDLARLMRLTRYDVR